MCFEYGFFNLVKIDGDEKCRFHVEIVADINGGKFMCEKAKRPKAKRPTSKAISKATSNATSKATESRESNKSKTA
jgi:hypothetical protein